MNFEKFLQTLDLEITSQFSPHLTKATFSLKTIRKLKQRMEYDFMSLFFIFIRILLHHTKPKWQSLEVFHKNDVPKMRTEKHLCWSLF